ncbi:unnamed protein product [Discula destructiva]
MEQTKALTALEPFLALTKSATSPRAAIDLIRRATKAPGTYIFTELLTSGPIAALATSTDPTERAWHTHLSLFSHGLYSTYTSTPNLPALDAAQTLKLRQLSLLTLSRDKRQLTYRSLLAHLGLASARDLEDVVISAVYAGVLTARLNPARQEVQVSSVAPLRDVPPATVPSLVRVLQQWSARCDATLAELEATMAGIRADAAVALERQRDAKALVDAAIEAEEKLDGAGGAGSGGGGGGAGGRVGRAARNRSAAAAAAAAGAGPAGQRGAPKRGMVEIDAGEEDEDDEAMDLDEEGGEGKQQLARRRKL